MKKKFKYTLKSKEGKVVLQSIVEFGNEVNPFPENWKEDIWAEMSVQNYKETFIMENFDIEISENLEFDI